MQVQKKFNINRISTLLGALFVFQFCLLGQTDSTASADSTAREQELLLMDGPDKTAPQADSMPIKVYSIYHTKIATISSAIIPGLGQAYNRKFWKIPLIYGAGAALYFSYDMNNTKYQRFKKAYNSEEDKKKDPELAGVETAVIKLNMDNFRRYRDLTIIGFGLLYAANIIDAMVDSYMTEFDVGKDLSLKLSPTILQPSLYDYSASIGIKMKFSF